MNLRNIFVFALVCIWLLDIVGWFVALFLWAIPTMSIGLDQALSLSVGTIVALVLYFVLWLPMMIYGLIFGIVTLLTL